jgi:hypothetical protein
LATHRRSFDEDPRRSEKAVWAGTRIRVGLEGGWCRRRGPPILVETSPSTGAQETHPLAERSKDTGLRVVVFDATGAGAAWFQQGLTLSWRLGSRLYRSWGRIDAIFGARSWEEALAFLASVQPTRALAEVQFWGHGRRGRALVGGDVLDGGWAAPTHPRHADVLAVRARLTGPDALWWFRTCETMGGRTGQAFASTWANLLGCRAAGHTYVIGPLQSGLHQVRPGETPSWSPEEGLRPGKPETTPALPSHPTAPNTITWLHGRIPAGW